MRSNKRALRGLPMAGIVMVLLVLPGCKRHHATYRGTEPDTLSAPASMASAAIGGRFAKHAVSQNAGQGYMAYEHRLDLNVPDGLVGAHLDGARTACKSAELCELVSANENLNDMGPGGMQHSARISVRLPHDRVEAFLEAASAPVKGEAVRDVVTREAMTTETDLRNDVTDVDRRLAQMTAYRDRLEALEAQSAGRTDDLIKVARELSEAQSSLEEAQRERNGLARRIDTEAVDVSYLGARRPSTPLRQSWQETARVFMETLGDVWIFLVQALVWAPVCLVGLLVARCAVRKGWFARQ